MVARAWPVTDIDPHRSVLENARRVIAVRIAEFYSYEPIVPHPEHSTALHDLRIAAKRLRYTLELFQPQFGSEGKRQIDRIKVIQEALGDLHDHDVRIAMIGDELSQAMLERSHHLREEMAEAAPDDMATIAAAALRPPPDDPRRGLIALLGREHVARRGAYERFRTAWEEFAKQGMRGDLVSLSITPLPGRTEPDDAA